MPTQNRKAHVSALPPKVSPPRTAGALPRTGLFRLLDNFANHPVTWICGPAGAGKTTLAASYLGARKDRYLWYLVDESDADLATFIFYLRLGAVQQARGRNLKLPLFTPDYLSTAAVFARQFFEKLFASRGSPTVLVLDNYQDMPADAALQMLLADNLSQLPKGVRVLVLSRQDAPPAWARAWANGAIAYVGWDDLRLTESETEALVQARMNESSIAKESVQHLHLLTHGWAAGIVLMLQKGGGAHSSAGPDAMERAEQATFDYFAQEILCKHGASIQSGLMRLAWLPAITPSAAMALTGDGDIERTLAELANSRTFTYRHVQTPASYVFHPLFRRFLQRRARETLPDAEVAAQQRAAAAVLMDAANWDDAATLLIEAKDWSSLANLISRHAPMLLAHGRHPTVESWLRALPLDVLDKDPWLLLQFGAARFPYSFVESRTHYERAFLRFEKTADLIGQVHAWSGIIETIVHEWSDSAALAPWLAIAEARLVREIDNLGDKTAISRLIVGMFWALMLHRPQHADMQLWAERIEELVQSVPDKSQRIMLGAHLAQYYGLWLGDFARAGRVLEGMRPRSVDRLSPIATIAWQMQWALYLFRRNQSDEAFAALEIARNLQHETGLPFLFFLIGSTFVYVAINNQEYERASAYLKEVAGLASMQRPIQMAQYEILSSWLARSRGEDMAALEHARRLVMLTDKHGGPFEQATACLELAYALHARGAGGEAGMQAQRALLLAEGMRSSWVVYLARLCLAYLALAGGDEEECDRHLRAAFATGGKNGYMSLHFLVPRTLALLCARALEHDIEPEYARDLVCAHRLLPDPPPIQVQAWPWPVRIRALGGFLVEVDAKPLQFLHKAQRRPLDLLMALIAFGGHDVPEHRLSGALWPDAEADTAHAAFTSALHRLRKLLRDDEAVVLSSSRVTLNDRKVWLDVWAFEHGLEASAPDAALAFYDGPFLGQEADAAWALPLRERLRAKFVRAVGKAASRLLGQGHHDEAVALLERGIEADEAAEELYRELIRAYRGLGRRSDALRVYQRCRRTLHSLLGVEPDAETEALYKTLKSVGA